MTHTRRTSLKTLSLSLVLLGLASAAVPAWAHDDDDNDGGGERGAAGGWVYTSSNAAAGNQVLVFARAADGSLSAASTVATGGLGSAKGLGSQGAVTLSRSGRYLFVVNAQSNDVSTFSVRKGVLSLISVTPSGGLHPISVTEGEGRVYVLNDGGAGNVVGFRNVGGTLSALKNGVQGLSAAGGTGPAQVGLSDDGDTLVVSEKALNKLVTYSVRDSGALGAPVVTASPGNTPFGFAFNRRNRLVVSEAWGGAAGASTVSSYRFSEAGGATPILVSAAVPDTQSAACWVAITPNGRYAYITNTASNTVSSYTIARNGSVSLLEPAVAASGMGPTDEMVSGDGRQLFVLNGRSASISSFSVGRDGKLGAPIVLSGLPATSLGLAAD